MVARAWREQKTRYRILGTKCKKCGTLSYPPRKVCPTCKSREYEDYQFKGEGEILTFTEIYSAPKDFNEFIPITIGLIKLDEGPKILSQIVDFENIKIGDRVESVFRKICSHGKNDVIDYGAKFRPKLV